jgi:hypothetical protein
MPGLTVARDLGERKTIGAEGLLKAPQQLQQARPVEMQQRAVIAQTQGLVIAGQGFIAAAQLAEGDTPVGPRLAYPG